MKRLTDIAVPIAPEERAILIAMCKAHDREDSAQRGEPDPWTLDSEEALDGSQWQEERVYAMREALAAFLSSAKEPQIDPLVAYLERQWAWSKDTFGPALRTAGVIQHIRKELGEIEADPHDLMEWVDVVILAMDGFWRHGGKPVDLLRIMQAKQDKNMARTWPDWRTMGEDQAIEHDRSHDAPALPSSGGGHE